MYLLGYSLNNLSLMALTIATGFVVDDAIVMIENIARYIEKGETPMNAAVKGAAQIGFTIISLTVSLIAVLIPLLFMGDVVGRLFREFAITLAITILISAVVSLTLVPMMSGRWLRSHADEKPGRMAQRTQVFFERVIERYDDALGWVLARQGLTLLIALATLVLTVLLYVLIPKGLFPIQDTGQLQARVEMRQAISYDRMAELQQAAAREILADPDVLSLSSNVGVDAANNMMMHTGRMLINLKDKRTASQAAIIERLRQRVAQVAGVTLYLQPTQDLTIDAETGPTLYRLSIEGADNATVTEWANKLVRRLQSEKQLRNVVSDAGATGAAAFVTIDRDSASRMSITAASIDDALYSAYGQRIVSTIFTETNQYRVILEAQREAQMSTAALARLPLRTASGKTTPLSAVASVTEQPAPLQITHVAQYPATTIGFDTAPGASLGQAVDRIKAAAADIGFPASVSMTFLGAAGAYQNSLSNQLGLILAAGGCVYIVLGVLYES
jgi:multidrug efflux pump